MDGGLAIFPTPLPCGVVGAPPFESLNPPRLSEAKSLPPRSDVLLCGLPGARGAGFGDGGDGVDTGAVPSDFGGPGAFIMSGGADPLGAGAAEGGGAVLGRGDGVVSGAGDLAASSAA